MRLCELKSFPLTRFSEPSRLVRIRPFCDLPFDGFFLFSPHTTAVPNRKLADNPHARPRRKVAAFALHRRSSAADPIAPPAKAMRHLMKQESAQHLQKARKLLDLAQRLIRHGYASDAVRHAYLVAHHAADALIVDRTGKTATSHESAHALFAYLTVNEPLIDGPMKRFLPEIYAFKTAYENGLGASAEVQLEQATEAVAIAGLFLERIAYLLTYPLPQSERSDAPMR
jgi:uncharacterized protein (UPF0332 family)